MKIVEIVLAALAFVTGTIAALMQAAVQSAYLNKIAAKWTAATVALSVIAGIVSAIHA